MILYPDVQRKAQAEIDKIVGNSRLPDFLDEGSLPYIQAVVKETLRWHPVGPLGAFLSVGDNVSGDRITFTGVPHTSGKTSRANEDKILIFSVIIELSHIAFSPR